MGMRELPHSACHAIFIGSVIACVPSMVSMTIHHFPLYSCGNPISWLKLLRRHSGVARSRGLL